MLLIVKQHVHDSVDLIVFKLVFLKVNESFTELEGSQVGIKVLIIDFKVLYNCLGELLLLIHDLFVKLLINLEVLVDSLDDNL